MIKIIAQYEERLRQAQLTSNVAELSELISDELQFIFFDGSIATKEMDLDAHQKGLYKFQTIEFSEQNIRIFENTAIVTVKSKVVLMANGRPEQGTLRYIRTWHLKENRWQIIGGSVTKIEG